MTDFKFPESFTPEDICSSITGFAVQRMRNNRIDWKSSTITIALPAGEKVLTADQLVTVLTRNDFSAQEAEPIFHAVGIDITWRNLGTRMSNQRTLDRVWRRINSQIDQLERPMPPTGETPAHLLPQPEELKL